MNLSSSCNTTDKLAELEKVILDYYLAKGYQVGIGGWGFKVNISTYHKQKEIQIMFRKNRKSNYETVFRIWQKTTKEMFDAAFEHFKIEKDSINPLIKFNIYQYDEFTPPFFIASFDNKNEAKEKLEKIQNESIKHDAYTCFCIKEEANEPIKNS